MSDSNPKNIDWEGLAKAAGFFKEIDVTVNYLYNRRTQSVLERVLLKEACGLMSREWLEKEIPNHLIPLGWIE